jgi:hypothetical protein
MELCESMVRGVMQIRAIFAAAIVCAANMAMSQRCLGEDGSGYLTGTNAASAKEKIDAAIDQLGSASYQERESATRELLHRGSTAIPPLESALPSAKGEVRYRIRSILDHQRQAVDVTTRRAAEQAITRIALGKDRISAAWAKSLQNPRNVFPASTEASPESAPQKQG